MILLRILRDTDAKAFDSIPIFNEEDRRLFFHLEPWMEKYMKNLKTASTKADFILSIGYFRAKHRFYNPRHYLNDDLIYICNQHGIPRLQVNFEKYRASFLCDPIYD